MSSPSIRKMKQHASPEPALVAAHAGAELPQAAEQPHSNGNGADAAAHPSGAGGADYAAAQHNNTVPSNYLGANGTQDAPFAAVAMKQEPDGANHQKQQQQQGEDEQMPDANTNPGGAADDQDPSGAGPVSSEDIQLVQNLIERCLQLYMTREEVISVLKDQATIESRFTQLVWQKLEEQNPEFFSCYYTRLKLKAQIVTFNHLLEQQVQVVQRMQRGWMSGGMGGSATASGIPLFQGGPGSSGGQPSGDGQHRPRDQVVPDPHADQDFGFPSLDGSGASPLFGNLPHIGSEPDLANLEAHNMPTPGELEHSLTFLPTTSPLNAHAAHLRDLELPRDGTAGSMPRNFSLSELAHLDGETKEEG